MQTKVGNWIDRNDPHARQLTVSDDGDSVIIDPAFDWGKAERPVTPKNKQVIYEMHIGTFNRPDAATTGTFATAIEKLDYLQGLGITAIELMPVTSMMESKGWGYNPSSIYAVESAYGGRRGFLEFVKACHERGLGVILDVVYNHFGPKTDLWQFDGWSENGRGGIYFYNDERGDTPWGGSRPDYGRPEVRQYILDNVTMWFTDYRVDGLRIDSTSYMRNAAGNDNDPAHDLPDAWSLFQDMNRLAHSINPNALMIAEDSSLNEFITKPIDEGGAGFDAQWGTAFPLAIRAQFAMESHNYGGSLDKELQHSYNGQPLQKIIFSDSHDTAGGATRLNEATTPGNPDSVFARQRLLLANAVTLTAPGMPMILQGEEFLQEGSFNDWQMLEWDKTTQFAGIVLAHQHLINLRKDTYGNTTGLTGPSINIFHQDVSNNVMAYHRWGNGGPHDDVIVIINFSDQRFKTYELYLPIAGMWHVRFNSSWKGYSPDFNETKTSTVSTDENSRITVELADYNVLILSQDPTT
jgi:1,4-alpha-glucan branching enzyme